MLLSVKHCEQGGTAPEGGAVPPTSPPSEMFDDASLRLAQQRAINDIIYVMTADLYINEKGFLLKAIDKLEELGYYKDNESIIEEYWKS